MAIRNCLGTTKKDIWFDIKSKLALLNLRLLLSKRSCPDEGKRATAMNNLNAFNAFVAKKTLDELNKLDKNNSFMDMSSPNKIIDDNFMKFLDEFERLACNGDLQGLIDLIEDWNKKHQSESDKLKYPNGLTDEEKSELLDWLDKNGFLDVDGENSNNGALADKDRVIIDDEFSNGLNDEDIWGGSNGVPYPDDLLENLEYTAKNYRCYEKDFTIAQYIVIYNDNKLPIVTDTKVNNLRRIHYDLLRPIYNYYFSDIDFSACALRITNGLMSLQNVNIYASGSIVSKHATGEAVDFQCMGIDPYDVFKDIRDGRIDIPYGVLAYTNNVHITLPYTFEEYLVEKVVIENASEVNYGIKLKFN